MTAEPKDDYCERHKDRLLTMKCDVCLKEDADFTRQQTAQEIFKEIGEIIALQECYCEEQFEGEGLCNWCLQKERYNKIKQKYLGDKE